MWPHAPAHQLSEAGAYILTAATSHHRPFFRQRERILHDKLLELADEHAWRLEAWAVFSNHYHFVAHSPDQASGLRTFIRRLHAITATTINRADRTPARRVWSNYWETHITGERAFLARLAYVHQNAVKHGLVAIASDYPWCSAGWFELRSPAARVAMVYSFPTDRVSVPDL